MDFDIWEQLKAKDEVAKCKKCGRKIWKYWHADSIEGEGAMEECAICFFDKGKK